MRKKMGEMVSGAVSACRTHKSALKDGEQLEVPGWGDAPA